MGCSLGSGQVGPTGGDSRVPSASTSQAVGSSCPPGFFSRYDSNSGGAREIQRTMLELLNQLDGFDSRGDVKVIMATNRIETLDPALIRPGHAAPAPSRGANVLSGFVFLKGTLGRMVTR